MAKQLTLLVGPPGSGKSTIAHKMKKEGVVRVNQDDQGKGGHREIFNRAILNKSDIVVDRMNFDKKQRERYLKPAREAGYSIQIIVLHVPLETCLERCDKRSEHPTVVTEEDARSATHLFFTKYERVSDSEADIVIREGWVTDKASSAIVCDLDGTLADVEHRRIHVRPDNIPEGKKFKPNWKRFFEEMTNDPVNRWCEELINLMSERYPIIYATGRPADYEEHTKMWLQENGLALPGSKLFMRQAGDYRKDSVVKEIILEFEIKTRHNILFIVDDRKQVVDMWRDHGYTVLQCAPGDF